MRLEVGPERALEPDPPTVCRYCGDDVATRPVEHDLALLEEIARSQSCATACI